MELLPSLARLASALALVGLAFGSATATHAAPIGSLNEPAELARGWRFAPGDDPARAAPSYDDSAWETVTLPAPWGRHGHREVSWGWYRQTLDLAPELLARGSELRLGLVVPAVESAYELYAGGELVGRLGGMPPSRDLVYNRSAAWAIPVRAVGPGARLTLALRVYRDRAFAPGGGGVVRAAPLFGRLGDLERRRVLASLPGLAFAAIFLVGAAYHVLLFGAWRDRVYLDFGLLLGVQAAFVFFTGTTGLELPISFGVLKEAEYLSRYLLPAIGMQFLWSYLGATMSPWLRGYQVSHLALACVVVAEPGLRWNLASVHLWEWWTLPLLIGIIVWIAIRAARGDRRAQGIGLGAVVLALAFVWDIARGRNLVQGPALASYGLLALASAMAAGVAGRLRSAHVELQALHDELEARVVDRTRDLDAARRLAEDANRAKSEFLANMSHEIRTPMAGVVGLTELLAQGNLGVREREYVEALRGSAETLERVVGEILDFAKIEAGHLEIQRSPFAPRELAHAVQTLFAPLARQKGLELVVAPSVTLPARLASDPARLRQVMVNLLGNAIKFTDRGEVRMALAADDGGTALFVTVDDTGPGVDPTAEARLFEPFVQADATASRRFGGTGLGLAISRRVVAALGGEIGYQRSPLGGARFWFRVPVEVVEQADVPLPASDRAPRAAARCDDAAARVLVVEDDPVSSLVVERLVEAEGHHVTAVDDGLAALELLAREQFDLVLLDCQLPGLDGYATVARLREREGAARHTPVVALTAHAMQGDRERCLAAGMDDYLTKPVGREPLARTLAKWLAGGSKVASNTTGSDG